MIKVFIHSLVVFVALVIIGNYFASPVSAHVLSSDGSIGAVLHIDPDDDPIAGSPTNLYLEFKDKQGHFTPSACDCTFTVYKDGKSTYSTKLFTESMSGSGMDHTGIRYTFPTTNVYQLEVTGTPKDPNAFQAFKLTYTIRVSRTSQSNSLATTKFPWVFLLLPLAAILIIFTLIRHKKLHISSLVIIVFLSGMLLHVFSQTDMHDHGFGIKHACCLTTQVSLLTPVIITPPLLLHPFNPQPSIFIHEFVFIVQTPARSPPQA